MKLIDINNCFYFILPVFFVRYILVRALNRDKLSELDYFPPAEGIYEKAGKLVYLVVNTSMLFIPLLMKIKTASFLLIPGMVVYFTGLYIYTDSIIVFCSKRGVVSTGIYSLSRNPQALSFIIMYAGISVISLSPAYFAGVLLLSWSFYQMAISEERWCRDNYGTTFDKYLKRTRRFL